MLRTYCLPLGDYQTNCYIIHEETSKNCCVIDPGYDADRILDKLESLGLKLEAVLLTHGHFDPVGAVKELASETGCQVYLHSAELTMPPMMTAGPLYYTKTYDEGSRLNLAGLEIAVVHTPGHTPGSVCLLCQSALFSGDTLFQGSCGRTDLPGGDWAAIGKSLNRLAAMEGNFWIYPGHGGSTTLRDEKKYNPYLR